MRAVLEILRDTLGLTVTATETSQVPGSLTTVLDGRGCQIWHRGVLSDALHHGVASSGGEGFDHDPFCPGEVVDAICLV